MGSTSSGSAPAGSATATPGEVSGGADGTGAPSSSGTASGVPGSGSGVLVSGSDVPGSGSRECSGPAANRRVENGSSAAATQASASSSARVRSAPARIRRASGPVVQRNQRSGKEHLGGGTAVRRHAHLHPDAVPRRQVPDREQTHVPGGRLVPGRRVGQS